MIPQRLIQADIVVKGKGKSLVKVWVAVGGTVY
jgi:hypothetical protein